VTGGATALLEGWRSSTVGVNLELDPEPEGAFEAIRWIKESLEVNIELASPDHFLPELHDWRQQSPFIGRFGLVDFHHYDLRAQALAKLARGFDREVDVRAMLERRLIRCDALHIALEEMAPRLERYPRVDSAELRERLAEICP
jgi:hypothetical protein